MLKVSDAEYWLHSAYLTIEGCLKNLNKFLFVGVGAFLVPIFYGLSFIDKTIVENCAIVSYWFLMISFCGVFYVSVKKNYEGKEVVFYYYFLMIVLLGGAIFSMSFAEIYAKKEQSDYKILIVFFYAAINTLIWKLFFYIIKFIRFLLLFCEKKEWFKQFLSKIFIENLLVLFFITLVFFHMFMSVQ